MFNMYTFDEFLSLSLIRARKKKKYRIFDMLMMFTFENQPESKSDPHFFLKIKSQLNNILLLYYRFFYKYWKKSFRRIPDRIRPFLQVRIGIRKVRWIGLATK